MSSPVHDRALLFSEGASSLYSQGSRFYLSPDTHARGVALAHRARPADAMPGELHSLRRPCRGVVAFLTELPAEPPVGANETDQTAQSTGRGRL